MFTYINIYHSSIKTVYMVFMVSEGYLYSYIHIHMWYIQCKLIKMKYGYQSKTFVLMEFCIHH